MQVPRNPILVLKVEFSILNRKQFKKNRTLPSFKLFWLNKQDLIIINPFEFSKNKI